MDLFHNLANGFQQALTVSNLAYGLLGCVLGTLVGVLPGLGPVATLAMLLPLTYVLEPTTGIIMLAGIYYGAQYGGSTTAILVNLPGESSSVVTAIDGYEMTKRGRAGSALAIAAIGSFFAGCVGTLILGLFAPQLARVAFEFGPVEYFALMCLGLVGAITLANGDFLKSVVMIVLGLMLGLVGSDLNSGTTRFTFGFLELEEGVEFVVVAMALYGFGEILANLGADTGKDETARIGTVHSLRPTRAELRQSAPAILRGSFLGSLLGILPGGGAALASFASYGLEKEVRPKHGEIPVGTGNIRGVAGPEAANNAAAQTSFIPMLTLGIPSTSTMALLMAALSVHDIQVGPQLLTRYADLFWALVASMLVGNLILLILNYPLIAIWVRLLSVSYRLLFPAIILLCLIGVYCVSYSVFPVFLLVCFVPVGYLLRRLGYEGAPLLLGLILGPQMEIALRRSLTLSEGRWMTFIEHPISAGLLLLAVVFMLIVLLPKIKKGRETIFQESE